MSQDDQQGLLPQQDAFKALVADVQGIIQASQGRIAAVVNTEIVTTEWQIGERIVREEQGGPGRAAYGEQLLMRLGRRLSSVYEHAAVTHRWSSRELERHINNLDFGH